MAATVDFGIDLGTTNSLIARYSQGKVEAFKNPIGHKETLPSVVAFRKERIIVGDKAKEYVEKDPENVFGSFKRKMGTSEVFNVRSLNSTTTPINLSAIVLRELKNFVYTNEPIDSIVITIPASFDTIQSNATKKAGYEAGFKEVILLQEPIAASLAYANNTEAGNRSKEQWLVYDLGGGTFDVALVKTEDGEMKIIDHEGDNFLGGLDFDGLIIDSFVIPHLQNTGAFGNLEHELKSSNGRYNKLYYILLHKAEEAKVLLSFSPKADIEFETEDDNGVLHEVFLTIQRTQFEDCIKPKIAGTIEMMRAILDKNELNSTDIKHILMVGGSTYIPYVRNSIKESLGIAVDFSIDPTTAIAVGAAYYAGSKARTVFAVPEEQKTESSLLGLNVRMAYQKTSQDTEEYFIAEFDGPWQGLNYRIVREDGGYDSGTKSATNRISEMLPLVKNSFNCFSLKVLDQNNNHLNLDIPPIGILQGKFNIIGQPLPNDICLEVDDFENNTTRLETIFEKNSILPIKKTITREISKTLSKGSLESVIINIVEGDRYSSPSSNQTIGVIEISAKDINRDLVKGSDVEITLEISESRDLKVTAYFLMTDQEFTNVFSPSERSVNFTKLKEDTYNLIMLAKQDLKMFQDQEKYEEASKLKKIMDQLEELHQNLRNLSADDVTDARYQMEDKMRKLSKLFDQVTVDAHIVQVKTEYFEAKSTCESWINTKGSDEEKKDFQKLIAREKEVLATDNKRAISVLTDKLGNLRWKISQKEPVVIISIFHHYADLKERNYPDEEKAKKLVELGEKALERKNYDEVLSIVYRLYALLPPEEKDDFKIKGTGIG